LQLISFYQRNLLNATTSWASSRTRWKQDLGQHRTAEGDGPATMHHYYVWDKPQGTSNAFCTYFSQLRQNPSSFPSHIHLPMPAIPLRLVFSFQLSMKKLCNLEERRMSFMLALMGCLWLLWSAGGRRREAQYRRRRLLMAICGGASSFLPISARRRRNA